MKHTVISFRPSTSVIVAVAAAVLSQVGALGQQPWRYPLRAGDHLVYSESIEKETIGPDSHYKANASFENHILVLDDTRNAVTIGIQRNRKSAELLQALPDGKQARREDRERFAQRLATLPDRIADANQLELSGGLRYAPTAIREWSSRTLIGFEEFPHISLGQLRVGDKWHTYGYLNTELTVKPGETLDGERCTIVEGRALNGHVRLRYWFSDSTRHVVRATYQAEYGVSTGTTRENVVLKLTDVAHDQTLEPWLASPETRLAALAALERFPALATSRRELQAILALNDPEAATLALSTIARRQIGIDPDAMKESNLTAEGKRLMALLRRGARLQAPTFAAGTTMQLFEDGNGNLIPYIVTIPRDYSLDQPAPLLVYLSGGAGVALDGLNSSVSSLHGSEYAVLYPTALGMWWEPETTAVFDRLLAKVAADLHASTEKTYVVGFSNGGSGAEYYAARWPKRFGASVSLMGAGECGVLDSWATDQLARVPLLLVHGRHDKTIPAECSQDLFRKLQKKKAKVRLELLDKGHEITLDTDQGLTLDFLRAIAGSAEPAGEKSAQ